MFRIKYLALYYLILNIYEPYQEIESVKQGLHLKRDYRDRLESMFYFRVLPLAALIFLYVRFVIPNDTMNAWLSGGAVFVVLSMAILLNTKIGDDILISNSLIQLVTRRIRGKNEASIALKDVDYIDVEIYNEPRISGAYYRLVLKNKKRIMLFRLSGILPLNDERLQLLDSQISKLTGLTIRHDWKGLEQAHANEGL